MSTVRVPAYLISSSGTVTLYHKGKSYSASNSHTNHKAIVKAIKDKKWSGIEKLFDVSAAIVKAGHKKLEVKNGQIYYGGVAVHNCICDKIFQFVKEGLDTKPLLAFLKRLLGNPSENSVGQMYKFIEANNLPITYDGHIIAYKRVREDYKDFYSGKFDNSVGAKPKMERSQVVDDPNAHCHRGLHIGGMNFVNGFNSGGHVMVCKVDPANVVSVPNDCSCGKCRACEYEVIAELPADTPEIQQTEALEVGEDTATTYEDCHGEIRCMLCDDLVDDCECDEDDNDSFDESPGCGDYVDYCRCCQ